MDISALLDKITRGRPAGLPPIDEWSLLILIVGGRGRADSGPVLHVLIEPGELFPQDVFNGLFAAISVRFERQENQPRDAAVAAHRLVHALRLNREGDIII